MKLDYTDDNQDENGNYICEMCDSEAISQINDYGTIYFCNDAECYKGWMCCNMDEQEIEY